MTEREVKHQRVAEYLDRKGLTAVALTRRENFAWYTGGKDNHVVTHSDVGAATLVVTKETAWCVTTNIEEPRLRDEEIGGDIEVIGLPWHDSSAIESRIHELIAEGEVASDDGGFGLPVLDADWAELRFSLLPEEIDRYRALGADCARVMETLCKSVRPGDTEADLAGRMHALACRRMVETYVCLIAADERILKYRHPIYTDKPVKQCAMVVMCGRRHGLIANLTRLIHFGDLPEDLRKRHDACCAVDTALNLGTRVGRPVNEIFNDAVKAYAELGFAGEWKLHHQGGPTGYAGRDYFATPEETRTVQPAQAFAWNPSIAGTKSEDTLLATRKGIEVFTQAEDWPMVSAQYEGRVLPRPGILVL